MNRFNFQQQFAKGLQKGLQDFRRYNPMTFMAYAHPVQNSDGVNVDCFVEIPDRALGSTTTTKKQVSGFTDPSFLQSLTDGQVVQCGYVDYPGKNCIVVIGPGYGIPSPPPSIVDGGPWLFFRGTRMGVGEANGTNTLLWFTFPQVPPDILVSVPVGSGDVYNYYGYGEGSGSGGSGSGGSGSGGGSGSSGEGSGGHPRNTSPNASIQMMRTGPLGIAYITQDQSDSVPQQLWLYSPQNGNTAIWTFDALQTTSPQPMNFVTNTSGSIDTSFLSGVETNCVLNMSLDTLGFAYILTKSSNSSQQWLFRVDLSQQVETTAQPIINATLGANTAVGEAVAFQAFVNANPALVPGNMQPTDISIFQFMSYVDDGEENNYSLVQANQNGLYAQLQLGIPYQFIAPPVALGLGSGTTVDAIPGITRMWGGGLTPDVGNIFPPPLNFGEMGYGGVGPSSFVGGSGSQSGPSGTGIGQANYDGKPWQPGIHRGLLVDPAGGVVVPSFKSPFNEVYIFNAIQTANPQNPNTPPAYTTKRILRGGFRDSDVWTDYQPLAIIGSNLLVWFNEWTGNLVQWLEPLSHYNIQGSFALAPLGTLGEPTPNPGDTDGSFAFPGEYADVATVVTACYAAMSGFNVPVWQPISNRSGFRLVSLADVPQARTGPGTVLVNGIPVKPAGSTVAEYAVPANPVTVTGTQSINDPFGGLQNVTYTTDAVAGPSGPPGGYPTNHNYINPLFPGSPLARVITTTMPLPTNTNPQTADNGVYNIQSIPLGQLNYYTNVGVTISDGAFSLSGKYVYVQYITTLGGGSNTPTLITPSYRVAAVSYTQTLPSGGGAIEPGTLPHTLLGIQEDESICLSFTAYLEQTTTSPPGIDQEYSTGWGSGLSILYSGTYPGFSPPFTGQSVQYTWVALLQKRAPYTFQFDPTDLSKHGLNICVNPAQTMWARLPQTEAGAWVVAGQNAIQIGTSPGAFALEGGSHAPCDPVTGVYVSPTIQIFDAKTLGLLTEVGLPDTPGAPTVACEYGVAAWRGDNILYFIRRYFDGSGWNGQLFAFDYTNAKLTFVTMWIDMPSSEAVPLNLQALTDRLIAMDQLGNIYDIP